jgi:hypothetical protein
MANHVIKPIQFSTHEKDPVSKCLFFQSLKTSQNGLLLTRSEFLHGYGLSWTMKRSNLDRVTSDSRNLAADDSCEPAGKRVLKARCSLPWSVQCIHVHPERSTGWRRNKQKQSNVRRPPQNHEISPCFPTKRAMLCQRSRAISRASARLGALNSRCAPQHSANAKITFQWNTEKTDEATWSNCNGHSPLKCWRLSIVIFSNQILEGLCFTCSWKA